MTNPFSNWSIADAEMHNQRVANVRVRQLNGGDVLVREDLVIKSEADLHAQIFDECRRRGWIALHGSMAERTSRTLGEPDFVLLCDNGRVLFVECKTAKGKLSIVQQAMIAHAAKLGTTIYVIRSMEEFLKLL